ncbi:MAG: hypothetical protein IPG48_00025 [Saprospiraceae bacterium]|nr:hypothetical protein [Saprospiraceae bacterium]
MIFPLVKLLKKSPSEIGDSLGNWMEAHVEDVVSHQTIQGFLNVSLSDHFWKQSLDTISQHLISDMPNQMAKKYW